jgi:N-acetylmuramoyl-L-alanine amidase
MKISLSLFPCYNRYIENTSLLEAYNMKIQSMKKWLVGAAATFTFLTVGQLAEASTTHEVHKGETIWNLANTYSVPLLDLKKANNKQTNTLYVGEKLTIPNAPFTVAEQDLLARLVSAEAKGEPYAGKVAVATVVLNRVASKDFPNTLTGVINEVSNGHYAFTPVQNGTIKQAATAESKRAAKEAIALKGMGKGSLFFYNPKTSTSKWITSRQTVVTIGQHVFAK